MLCDLVVPKLAAYPVGMRDDEDDDDCEDDDHDAGDDDDDDQTKLQVIRREDEYHCRTSHSNTGYHQPKRSG